MAWALGGAVCVAAFVVPWKLASEHGDAATNTLLLLTSAALFTSVLTAFQQRSVPWFSGFDLRIAAGLAVLTLFGNLASAHAIDLVSPALLTVVQRGEVIATALLAWFFIGERVNRRFWVGAAIAIAGLVILQDPFSASEARTSGVLWALGSALCFGSMAVLTRRFITRIDTVSVNALRLWLSVGFWFLLNGVPGALAEVSFAQVGFVALAAFFGPFAGRLCMMNSAHFLEARITTLATLAAPPLTLLFAWMILGDLPGAREIQGGLLMLVGISIPMLGTSRR
jgi:drug/metabolite transporter (DMT)-like permease